MEQIKNLGELIKLVDNTFVCNEKVYRKLKFLPKEIWPEEIMAHSARHLAKSSGKLNGVFEAWEHGEEIDGKMLREQILSSFATLCKLAAMTQMTEEEIFRELPAMLSSNQPVKG